MLFAINDKSIFLQTKNLTEKSCKAYKFFIGIVIRKENQKIRYPSLLLRASDFEWYLLYHQSFCFTAHKIVLFITNSTSLNTQINQFLNASLYGIPLYLCFNNSKFSTYLLIRFSFPCMIIDGFRLPTIIVPDTKFIEAS